MKVYFKRIPVVLLLVLIIVSGCQKTPDREVVVDKRNLMEKIEVKADSKEYDIPSSWQEILSMKGNEGVIEINASINTPNVSKYPIYKTKQSLFDTENIEELVEYFTSGEIIIKDDGPTKEELEHALILAKKSEDEEIIAGLEEQIEALPDDMAEEEITNWDSKSSLSGYFFDSDGIKTLIDARKDTFSYSNGFIMSNSIFEMNDINLSTEVLLPVEDAVSIAQNMLHDIGIDYMINASFETAYQYSSMYEVFINDSDEYLSKGYLIKFARIIDGIEGIINDSCIYNTSEEINYKAPMYPEEIQVYVNELGEIKYFLWKYPLEIGEKLNDNVELLSFKDIKKRIRDMLIFRCSYDENAVQVTNVDMKMTVISAENELSEAIYVPAWFVNYTVTREDMDEEFREQEYTVVLNAIDGGRIIEFPIEASDIQE